MHNKSQPSTKETVPREIEKTKRKPKKVKRKNQKKVGTIVHIATVRGITRVIVEF